MNLYIVVYFIWIVVSSTRVDGGPGNTDRQRESQDRQTDPQASERVDKDVNPLESYPDEAIDKLSKVFGISRIPKHFRHGTPPEYMIELYNMVAYEDGITKQAAPYNANTVRGVPDGGKLLLASYTLYSLHLLFHLYKCIDEMCFILE
jgi:hypothetical protein